MNLTATATATRLGVSLGRVYALIRAGRLPAVKFGRDWQIAEQDVMRFAKLPRKAGRPPAVRPAATKQKEKKT